jgi:hypothetical protein
MVTGGLIVSTRKVSAYSIDGVGFWGRVGRKWRESLRFFVGGEIDSIEDKRN